MKINFLKFFLILPMFLVMSQTVFANVAAPNPAHIFIFDAVFVMGISLVEFLIIKFGLKTTSWKAIFAVFIANVLTSIVGFLFFEEFLLDFHSSALNFDIFVYVLFIFGITLLMESSILGLFLKKIPFRRVFRYSFFANLLTYLILILIINIPYIL